MKNLFTFLLLMTISSLSVFGQGKVDYDTHSRFYLGFNLGGTYHSNTEVDVNRLYRGGAGFTFGYSFGMKPNRLLSLDLQLRYLLAAYRGQSESKYTLDANTNDVLNNSTILTPVSEYETQYGYYVPNFHTWVNDWSLELKLNTNRLRERTGWNFFVLGGIGYNKYHTEIDFYNDDFSGVITDEADLFKKDQFISDYETNLITKWDWMPSFGAGIERQITPNAAFTIMGRMTWTRNNDFDGLTNTFNGNVSSVNDRYHYASAGIKFYLRGKNEKPIEDDVIDTPVGQAPKVIINDPNTSPLTVNVNQYNLLATVHFVTGSDQIKFTQNGSVLNGFNYNANSDAFQSNVYLVDGQNVFVITGTNDFGQDQDETIIIYKETLGPIVDITNPSTSPITVKVNTFNFQSKVLNVSGKNEIQVNYNGQSLSNFNYNISTQVLTTGLNLVKGNNLITVTASNQGGTDSESATIVFEEEIINNPPPVVTFTNPSVSPKAVNNSNIDITAQVLNVVAKNYISVKVNGKLVNSFNYNANSNTVSFNASLINGSNTIQVRGVNAYGQDQAVTIVTYNRVQNVQPPIVTITAPSQTPYITNDPSIQINGKVLHVNSKNNITIKVNGVKTSSFNYNISNNLVNFVTTLKTGSNVIQIVGVNADGQDQATTTIIYKKPVTLNPPVVTITNPALDNTVVTSSSLSLSATVLNVSGSNNITVNVNGSNMTGFSFNSSSKILTLPLSLVAGKNTIIITGTNSVGTDSKTRLINYKKAVLLNPPTVNYTNPTVSPVNVNNLSFTVVAFTTNIGSKNQIIFKQNGSVINQSSYSFSSQNISYPTTLISGSNVFEVVVSNASGTDSKTTVINYTPVNNPCTSPTVGYVAPQPNSTVNIANHNIEAQINNHIPGTTVQLSLNGVPKGNMSFNSNTQIANKNVILNLGANTLEITVSNTCGTNKSTFILTYQTATPPCVDPVVTINGNNSTITTLQYNFSGTVINTTSKNQLNLMVNGSARPFNYIVSNGGVTANLNLVQGLNTIVLSGANACGSDTKSINITANTCVTPKLTTISPIKLTPNTTTANFSLTAGAVGVLSQQDITVTNNGNAIPFNYSSATKKITVSVSNLIVGLNQIKVKVSNSCGTDELIYNVTRNQCLAPTINVKTSTTNVTSLAFQFTAVITQMASSNGITLKLNGVNVPFNFNAQTNILMANLIFKNGANSILLTATNSCGTDSKTNQVTATICVNPKLTSILPTQLTSATTTNTFNLDVGAIGVLSQQDITVTNNGNAIPFNYSSATKKITVSVSNLIVGLNQIKVKVSNSCGIDELIYNVTRNQCLAPTINVKTSTTNVTSLAFQFTAVITQMASSNGITLKLNGVNVPFNFNAQTNILIANLIFKNGANSILLTATNSCGTDSKTNQVTATICVNPKLTSILPTQLTSTTTTNTFNLGVGAIGVLSQQDITVTNNGIAIPFNYSSATKKITVSVSNLIVGLNQIKVKVSNSCGTDELIYKVTRNECLSPVVTIKGNQSKVSVLNYNFSATIAQMSNSNGVSLKLNGATIPFNFNAQTKLLTASIVLKNGNNTILLAATNSCGSDSKSYNVTATACINPKVTAFKPTGLVQSTTKSNYAVEAIALGVANKNELTVKLNGLSVPFSFSTSTKKVIVSVNNLKIGLNNISIAVSNSCGKSGITYKVTRNQCLSPTVSINSKATKVTKLAYPFTAIVKGMTSKSGVSLLVNGADVAFNFSAQTEELNANLNLKKGQNTILLKATNSCGTASKLLNVSATICVNPLVTAFNPVSLLGNTTVSNYKVVAMTKGITNKQGITVKLNGANIPFSFSTSTKKVTVNASKLKMGLNTIMIQGSNPCGKSSITYKITRKPCVKPVVKINNTNTNVTSHNYAFSGKVTGVTSVKKVSLKVNGVIKPVSFNLKTGVVTGNLTLVEGVNTIQLIGANTCGSANKSLTVTATTCQTPNVKVGYPTNLSVTTSNSVFVITAKAFNVSNQNEIVVTNNGNSIPFTFNAPLNQVTTSVSNMTPGNNNIKIKATNACGTSSITYVISYGGTPNNNKSTTNDKNTKGSNSKMERN